MKTDDRPYTAAFTEEQQQQLIKVLESKVVLPCSSCGQKRRQLVPSLFLFPVGDTSRHCLGPLLAPFALPCVSMVCAGCGHTEFYNAHALGIAATLGIPAPGTPMGVGSYGMPRPGSQPNPPYRKCRWPWSHVWGSWRVAEVVIPKDPVLENKVPVEVRSCALCNKQQIKTL